MRLRLASYNIQKAVGLDLRRDPHRVLKVINELDADVVALQEADKRLGDRPAAIPHHLIEAETDFAVVDFAQTHVSLGWHGNAILARRDLEVCDRERIPLPGLEPRGAVKVTVRKGGQAMSVVGVHLGLLRSWRRRQARALHDHIDDEEHPRTVILGDFNEWSRQSGLEPLTESFSIVTPGRTFHAARPVASLDRAAMGDAVELVDAGVDESALAKLSSDHLPIWVDAQVS